MTDLKEKLRVSSNQSILNFLDALEENGFIKREKGQARSIEILSLGFQILGRTRLIPMLGVSAAGAFIESPADISDRWELLPGEIIKNEKILQAEEQFFVIQVSGDSMLNANINDGDSLLIKKTNEFRSGDIVVARNDDGTTVKRFIAEDDGRAYLKPENPKYKNLTIYEDTYFDGKVIANLSLTTNIKNND